MKQWFVAPFALLLLVAVTAFPALAASSRQSAKYYFTLTGQVVSVNGSTIVVKVTRATKALTSFEKQGALTLMLVPKASIRMGAKRIGASALKPSEKVSVRGWYVAATNPTFEATTITVLSAH